MRIIADEDQYSRLNGQLNKLKKYYIDEAYNPNQIFKLVLLDSIIDYIKGLPTATDIMNSDDWDTFCTRLEVNKGESE